MIYLIQKPRTLTKRKSIRLKIEKDNSLLVVVKTKIRSENSSR